MEKPLIWELVRDTERFQFLAGERVEHIVIQMPPLEQAEDDIWWGPSYHLKQSTNTLQEVRELPVGRG